MDTSAAMHSGQPRAALGQVDADDPDAFNHCFAEVNGIRMHYIDEGQARSSFCCMVFLTSGTCGGARSWLWPRPAFGSSSRSTGIWANRSAIPIEAYDMSQAWHGWLDGGPG